MRLSKFEIESIKSLAGLHFGTDVEVFLFGSRTDNHQRGGDIDLFISNPECKHVNARTKIAFVTDLIMMIGEQRIDVVLDNPVRRDSQLFKTIRNSGIKL